MDLISRELWALIHGVVLGGAFLVAFAGGLAGFYSLRAEYLTEAGIAERTRRLVLGTGGMAALTWLTVIVASLFELLEARLEPDRLSRLGREIELAESRS